MQRRDRRDASELDRQIDEMLSSPERIDSAAQGDDPLLRPAARLAQASHPILSAEARSRVRSRILPRRTSLHQPDFSFLAQRLIASFVLVILLAFASIPASAETVPGDLLYPVKLGWESAELALARTPTGAAHILLIQANRRLDEQQKLYAQTRIDNQLFERSLEKLSAAVTQLQSLQPAAAQSLRSELGSTYQRFQSVLKTAEAQALIATSGYEDYAAMAEAVASRGGVPIVAALAQPQSDLTATPLPTVQTAVVEADPEPEDVPAINLPEITAEVPVTAEPQLASSTAEPEIASVFGFTQLSTPYAGQPAFIYARHVVNVRSGPGTNYSVITTLQPDTLVSVISSDTLNEWLQIEMVDGQIGWIAAYLLTLEPSSQEIITVHPEPQPTKQFSCDQPGNSCNAPGQQNPVNSSSGNASGNSGNANGSGNGSANGSGNNGNNGQGGGRGNRP